MQIIHYIMNNNIYINTNLELDLETDHLLTIISTTDFLKINELIDFDYIVDGNKELKSKDINVFREYKLKSELFNYFSDENTFVFKYKKQQLDSSGTSLVQTYYNILDHFNVILSLTDNDNKELKLR